MTKLYGSVEAGGTKFVCAVGNEEYQIIEQTQFPTSTPEETINQTIAFFKKFGEDIQSIGIGSFGPIDIDPTSSTYGYITNTPKPNWANVDLVGPIQKALDVPIYFTTDVNSSVYGEMKMRKDIHSIVYYTIGTGIGAGAIQKGEFIGGIGHTEAGHTLMARHEYDREHNFHGVCPYHKDCLEGLAAGPSLEARTGIRGEHIEADSIVWDVQAHYIAQAALQATLLYRPQVIVFGGGVMSQPHMLERVKTKYKELMNGYVETPDIDEYIVTPIVENNGSATIGNFALAKHIVE